MSKSLTSLDTNGVHVISEGSQSHKLMGRNKIYLDWMGKGLPERYIMASYLNITSSYLDVTLSHPSITSSYLEITSLCLY